jgi:hypothetical protein
LTEDYTQDDLDRTLRLIAASPSKFASAMLDFHPFPYQMKMLEDLSKKIVVCAARRVGKSYVTAVKALWFAFTHPKTSTLIVASTQRQSMLLFDKLLDFVESKELLNDSVVRKTRTILQFTNGSRIVALPCGRNGRTLRGETAHLIIIDEAAFVPEDVILSVMSPMLATTDGDLILLSTPYDRDHFFYRATNMASFSKYKFKTSDNPMVKQEYLDQRLEMLGEKRFRQEYLAEFVDDESTFFPMNLLRPCFHACEDFTNCVFCSANSGKIFPSGELYAGYDPGGMSDPAALVVLQKVSSAQKTSIGEEEFEPAFRVVMTKKFASKSGEKHEDVYTRFTVEIADIHKKMPFRKILVDSTGIGSPILAHCKELGLPAEGMIMHRRKQEEIFSNLKILFERKKIELPDDMDLSASLNCINAERTRTGGYDFTHPSGTHDDLAYALALAAWAGGLGASVIMMKGEPPKKSGWRPSPGDSFG